MATKSASINRLYNPPTPNKRDRSMGKLGRESLTPLGQQVFQLCKDMMGRLPDYHGYNKKGIYIKYIMRGYDPASKEPCDEESKLLVLHDQLLDLGVNVEKESGAFKKNELVNKEGKIDTHMNNLWKRYNKLRSTLHNLERSHQLMEELEAHRKTLTQKTTIYFTLKFKLT